MRNASPERTCTSIVNIILPAVIPGERIVSVKRKAIFSQEAFGIPLLLGVLTATR
jgi:hypothetical protein